MVLEVLRLSVEHSARRRDQLGSASVLPKHKLRFQRKSNIAFYSNLFAQQNKKEQILQKAQRRGIVCLPSYLPSRSSVYHSVSVANPMLTMRMCALVPC